MTCKHCGTAPAVTLQTGKQACTWCPEWRLETGAREMEARQVIKLESKEFRRARIAAWAVQHGNLGRERLEAVVRDLWPRRDSLIGVLCTRK